MAMQKGPLIDRRSQYVPAESQEPVLVQDAVRGDHGEVAQLLEREGARIYKSSEKRLVELAKSHVAG